MLIIVEFSYQQNKKLNKRDRIKNSDKIFR